jgi:hypothetical protein
LAQPWPAKKILLSEAVAASVIELRTLKSSTQKTRQAQFPKNLRTWVAERAAEGDARSAAQLRGWRYADQRNQRRLEATLEANALHLGPEADEEKSDWSEFMQQRLAAQQRAENVAGQIATARIWTINRTTEDVSYTLNGNSIQLIGYLICQRKHESGINTLEWNVEPLVVVEGKKLRLRGLGFEIHDDVFRQGVLPADFEHGKKLAEMALGEFGIDGQPELSALLCGRNDPSLRPGCGLLRRGHVVSLS